MIYAKLSLMGMYNYDNTLLDGLQIPIEVDRETLITNLLIETADLEILYSNPLTMKVAIEAWSNSRINSWNKMSIALTEEYNPIHNYDRYEEYADKVLENGSSEGKVNSTNSAENNNFVSGFNTNAGLTLASKNTGEGTGTNTSTGKVSNDKNVEHKAHLYGNIGVTTSQQMIDAELELRKTDLYEIIIKEFKHKFCVLVY